MYLMELITLNVEYELAHKIYSFRNHINRKYLFEFVIELHYNKKK